MPACKRGVVSHASLAVPHRPEYGFSPIDSAQQIGASSPFSLGDPMTAPRICPECQQRTGLARRGYGAGPPRRGRRHHGLPVVRPRVDRRADRPARPSDTNDEVASPPFTFPLVPRPILGRWRFCPPLIAARLALESDHARGLRFDVTERPHAPRTDQAGLLDAQIAFRVFARNARTAATVAVRFAIAVFASPAPLAATFHR